MTAACASGSAWCERGCTRRQRRGRERCSDGLVPRGRVRRPGRLAGVRPRGRPDHVCALDEHAVYLGHPGANMSCPATVVGRAEAVLVEPVDGGVDAEPAAASAEVTATSVNGMQAQVADGGSVTNEVDATFPTAA